MTAPRSDRMPPWAWAVLLVTSVHLLTTSGGWWITDHGEILALADRFLTTGHLDLKDLGPGWEDWTRIVAARKSVSSRFLPFSILALVPFLALDHLAGWREPAVFKFVHLQGHFFVGLGLALVGRFVARVSGSASTAALSVLLLGLNWPVWMIARRIGPEPVLFALLAAFATGGSRRRFASLVLLPWVHASGALLGLGSLLALAAEPRSVTHPRVRVAGLGWVLGVTSVAFFWNLPVHGHLVLGGYRDYASDAFFTLRNPLVGVLTVAGPMLAWTLPLWAMALREGRRVALVTLALWLPIVIFLSVFSNPEPERRLAPLLAVWTVALMVRTPPVPAAGAIGLAALSLASGVIGLSRDFVDVVVTPLGIYSGPFLMPIRLAFVKGQPALASAWVLLWSIAFVIAGSRALPPILRPHAPELDQTGSLPHNPGS